MAQQTLDPDETVIAEASDGTKLLVYRDLLELVDQDDPGELVVELSEIDHEEGAIRFVYADDIGPSSNDMEFEKFRDARLAYGLWLRCGPFNQPEGRSVPREIATDGQDAVTAYIHLNNGIPLKRAGTASICGVTEQTVSDRLSRVRWTPEDPRSSE